jgi:hypothetical protein
MGILKYDIFMSYIFKKEYLHHGAEPFLTSRQLCSYWRDSPTFYGIRRLITVFNRSLHWSLSWARSIQSIPSHRISLRYILILSTNLRLGLHSGLFYSDFPTNIVYAFLFSPIHVIYLSISSSLTSLLTFFNMFSHQTNLDKTSHFGRDLPGEVLDIS